MVNPGRARTRILVMDPVRPDPRKIGVAARVIRSHGTVAFPTETVYGIGADAFDAGACLKVFKAKGRPADNPMIVHVASFAQLEQVARSVPRKIERAMRALWPGPVTFVLPKARSIPPEVTGGLDTVAVRMPAHPIALQLIRESGVPIAAPSANISSRPSGTDAEHVIHDLYGKVDMIIDGGSALFGVESTVIDATSRPYALLRPGAFTVDELRMRLGRIVLPRKSGASRPRSPGMKYKHYAPQKRLILVAGRALLLRAPGLARRRKLAVLCSDELAKRLPPEAAAIRLGSERNMYEITRNFFGALRELDGSDADLGLMQSFPRKGIGLALMDRAFRASGARIVSSAVELEEALR